MPYEGPRRGWRPKPGVSGGSKSGRAAQPTAITELVGRWAAVLEAAALRSSTRCRLGATLLRRNFRVTPHGRIGAYRGGFKWTGRCWLAAMYRG
jgi:hypothetical protein